MKPSTITVIVEWIAVAVVFGLAAAIGLATAALQ